MKLFSMIALAAALAAPALMPSGAEAQGRIYKWCLEQSRSTLGGEQTLCRFNSLAQCNASKNSLADRCIQNYYGERP